MKKLVVALSVLATGVSAALFFRKDASQFDFRQEASSPDPFRQRIERRVSADAAWSRGQDAGQRPQPALRVAPATASIPQGIVSQSQPTFQKSFNPVGALLEPIDGVPPDAEDAGGTSEIATIAAPIGPPGTAEVTHKIVDGDTLSKLAVEYLGSAERYLEIYELNRDVLTNPDLLPIGTLLKIPSRVSAPAGGTQSSPLDLVPVPAAGEHSGQ